VIAPPESALAVVSIRSVHGWPCLCISAGPISVINATGENPHSPNVRTVATP
jgi:hypothetical protein